MKTKKLTSIAIIVMAGWPTIYDGIIGHTGNHREKGGLCKM